MDSKLKCKPPSVCDRPYTPYAYPYNTRCGSTYANSETAMAATRKSPQRSGSKKRSTAKKKGASKASTKSSRSRTKKVGRSRTKLLQRSAKKGLGAARDGFDSVLEAGGKTWRTLKNTTALMVEGVKESLAGEPETSARKPRLRR